MINFNELQENTIEHLRGGNGSVLARTFADPSMKIMKLTLKTGCSIGLHTHETNCEVIYVLSGTATCTMEGKSETLHTGEAHYCPKGGSHMTENLADEDLVILCIIPEC